MLDLLTGLSFGNSLGRQLTQPGGFNSFNAGSLFGPPIGSFDSLTGLSFGNSLGRQLTQPGGFNSFNAGSLFGPPIGSLDNFSPQNQFGGFDVLNINSLFGPPLGASNRSFSLDSNPLNLSFANSGISFGTGNRAASQASGLIPGILNGGGGPGLGALANQATVFAGGLQALPEPINGVPNFF